MNVLNLHFMTWHFISFTEVYQYFDLNGQMCVVDKQLVNYSYSIVLIVYKIYLF